MLIYITDNVPANELTLADLTKFAPRRKPKEKKNLLDTTTEEKPETEKVEYDPSEIISYWWQNMTINLVAHHGTLPVVGNPLVMKRILDSSDCRFANCIRQGPLSSNLLE
jgi:hypothetical protein